MMDRQRTRLAATVLALTMGLALLAPAAPVAAAAPGAPSGVKASPGPGRAVVKWTTPVSDGGTPITGYQVTPYVDGQPRPVRSFPAGDNQRGITGLANGTTYTFTVRAVNADGTGPESAPSAPILVARMPTAPQYVTAVPGHGEATVYWTAPASDGGSPITGYRVRIVWTGEPVPIYTVPATARSFVFPNLTNGSSYRFQVEAVNDVQPGPTKEGDRPVTPFPADAPGYHPFVAWNRLVSEAYLRLADRHPDTEDHDRWVAALSAGTATTGDLVVELRGSALHRTIIDPIVRLYQAYFLRMPDRDGLEYWVGRRLGGQSLVSVSAFMARSNEFETLYGELTDEEFVELIYENILGRPGEPDGIAYWTGEISSGRRNRGQVMLGFPESAEYRGDQANEVTVTVLYLLLLGRPAMAEERQRDVAALDDGQPVETLGRTILHWVPLTA